MSLRGSLQGHFDEHRDILEECRPFNAVLTEGWYVSVTERLTSSPFPQLIAATAANTCFTWKCLFSVYDHDNHFFIDPQNNDRPLNINRLKMERVKSE